MWNHGPNIKVLGVDKKNNILELNQKQTKLSTWEFFQFKIWFW